MCVGGRCGALVLVSKVLRLTHICKRAAKLRRVGHQLKGGFGIGCAHVRWEPVVTWELVQGYAWQLDCSPTTLFSCCGALPVQAGGDHECEDLLLNFWTSLAYSLTRSCTLIRFACVGRG